MLPEVLDCAADFGIDRQADILGAEIPILGVAGDQQAATIGQACFEPGMMKSTYGTGCFALLNTGSDMVRSKNRLLTTIAYRLDGETTYALEGSIFIAGAAVQWLRDGLGVIDQAARQRRDWRRRPIRRRTSIWCRPSSASARRTGTPNARGAIFGLTRNDRADRVRPRGARIGLLPDPRPARRHAQGLEALDDATTVLRVDGGMVASDWTMQRLADILDAPVDRPKMLETTALGAAWLAGSRAGVWPDREGFSRTWALDRQFTPKMDAKRASAKIRRLARCRIAHAEQSLIWRRREIPLPCSEPRAVRRSIREARCRRQAWCG